MGRLEDNRSVSLVALLVYVEIIGGCNFGHCQKKHSLTSLEPSATTVYFFSFSDR